MLGARGYYWIRSRVNGSDFELRSGRPVISYGMSWIREKVSIRQDTCGAGEKTCILWFFLFLPPYSQKHTNACYQRSRPPQRYLNKCIVLFPIPVSTKHMTVMRLWSHRRTAMVIRRCSRHAIGIFESCARLRRYTLSRRRGGPRSCVRPDRSMEHVIDRHPCHRRSLCSYGVRKHRARLRPADVYDIVQRLRGPATVTHTNDRTLSMHGRGARDLRFQDLTPWTLLNL